MSARITYRVWLTLKPAHEALTIQERAVQRSTFVLYEGTDRRHAKRLVSNLATAWSPNVTPHVVIAESGWEVLE